MQLKLSAGDFKNNKTEIRNPEAEKKDRQLKIRRATLLIILNNNTPIK